MTWCGRVGAFCFFLRCVDWLLLCGPAPTRNNGGLSWRNDRYDCRTALFHTRLRTPSASATTKISQLIARACRPTIPQHPPLLSSNASQRGFCKLELHATCANSEHLVCAKLRTRTR